MDTLPIVGYALGLQRTRVKVRASLTATVDYAPYMARIATYLEAVSEVLAATPPFAIDVRGVTLTPGAVPAQGFPRGDTLATLRDKLRAALRARGLGDGLDQRYRLVTAQMTLVRFATPLRAPERFVATLAAARESDFGSTMVARVELVFGDWFHTAAVEHLIAHFVLHRDSRRCLLWVGSVCRGRRMRSADCP